MCDYTCECKFAGKTFDKEFESLWLHVAEELQVQHKINGRGQLFRQKAIGSPCDSGFESMWQQIAEELRREEASSELSRLFAKKLQLYRLHTRWSVHKSITN